ncbi:hypothetical protein AB6D11_06030 [Vibrio splendidus]
MLLVSNETLNTVFLETVGASIILGLIHIGVALIHQHRKSRAIKSIHTTDRVVFLPSDDETDDLWNPKHKP